MRSRSGAFHADTEESFLDLAIASQNTTGLFYDNRVNCKIMKTLNSKKINSNLSRKIIKTPPIPAERKEDLFSGFDFSIEIEVARQEREQLERMKSEHLKQINVGIITNRSSQVLQDLSQLLGVPAGKQPLSRGVNLVVTTRNQTICKYWIFQKQSLAEKDELLSLYLNHCSQLYDIDQGYHDFSVLRSGTKVEAPWIKQNISTILI